MIQVSLGSFKETLAIIYYFYYYYYYYYYYFPLLHNPADIRRLIMATVTNKRKAFSVAE